MSFNITAAINNIIQTFGYTGVGLIIFAESGLMLGFMLPGDSLIFLAGLLAARGYFNIAILLLVIFFAALAGDNVGYFIGYKLGRKVFKAKDSFIFNQENLLRTEAFFEQYGKMTFFMQRFLPVIRAFAPLLAGVGRMRYKTFFLFDLAGTAVWTSLVTLLGFYLGTAVPNIDTYILPITLLIIVVSLIPTVVAYRKKRAPRK